MPTLTANATTTGFLSQDFPHKPPRLYVTAESDDADDFDHQTLKDWAEEGFDVHYVPMKKGGKEYAQRLDRLKDVGLGVGETYAVVAYGEAAALCLEHYRRPSGLNKICALIAYYPTAIPDPSSPFSSRVRVLVHLAGSVVDVSRTQQLLGIQGKRRTVSKRISPGTGTGGTLQMAYPAYSYQHGEPGFAEHDLDEYDRVSAELAFSRTLDVLRRAFRRDADLETAWEKNVHNKFLVSSSSLEKRLTGMTQTLTKQHTPHVTYTPTLTGGIGEDELRKFYGDFFIRSNPDSMRLRLLSRTIGADRLVDEVHMSFKHSQVMPWILPSIPATHKRVEVVVVSIVCVRGGKLYSEHVYWDQASVLLQVGLLDPNLVPQSMKQEGVSRLPVVGREAARRILGDDNSEAMNELIKGWKSGESEESASEGTGAEDD